MFIEQLVNNGSHPGLCRMYIINFLAIIFKFCSHHAWVSFDASAEIYELNRETSNTNLQNLEQYLNLYPLATPCSGRCNTMIILSFVIGIIFHLGDDANKRCSSHCTNLSELHCKIVASAFWNHQVEAELRERGWEEYLFANTSSQEDCMRRIDEEQAKSVCSHDENERSEECKR